MSTITAAERRSFLTAPGEHLLVNSDPLSFVRRFDEFIEASGIPAERTLASPLLTVPLPVAERAEDGHPRRWSGAKASFMWHPLMWLPRTVALRAPFQVADEAPDVESDSAWSVRVAQELVAGGLYDPVTGTWLDVLAHYGLNVDDPAVQERVGLWLHGAGDEILDSIDLSEFVTGPEHAAQMLQSSHDLADVLVPAQWAMTSTGIIETIEMLLADTDVTEDDRRHLLDVMAQVAAVALHDVPEDPETGLDVVDMIGLIAEEAEADRPSGHPVNSAQLLDALCNLLADVAADYALDVQVLNDAARDLA
ncbi:hypothetical protein [Microbacterium xylanilyticum]